MLNEPPDPQEHPSPQQTPRPRRPHPLEQKPEDNQAAAAEPTTTGKQRAVLHIPTVRPLVTYLLIAANLIVFLFAFLSDDAYVALINWGAVNRDLVFLQGEYHRLISAMFLHFDLSHIVFNMFSLYLFGTAVEAQFGHLRFALIYGLGGLTGSIMSAILSGGFSVGASGAVFAVFGAEMIYIYQHRKLLGEHGRRLLRNLVFIAALNFGFGIVSSFGLGTVSIDNWGHIGGFLGGMLLTWYIGPVFLLVRHPEHPQDFLAQDMNPLTRRTNVVSLFIAAQLAVLIAASLLFRA